VNHTTVGRLLHEQHYTLKANEKRLSGTSHPDRNQQFEYLESLRTAYLAAGQPVIQCGQQEKGTVWQFQKQRTGMVSEGNCGE